MPVTTGLARSVRAIAFAIVLAIAAARPAPAASPRYAAFMVDAASREVLYANAADEARHPASLTKIMTLYLVFDALEAKRLRLTDRVPVSRLAASQAPSRLGLAVGQSLPVDNAISVVAVKSANDIAVALAERVAGSVPAFVAMMNAKARLLGMRNTHFANPNGLTDRTNVTTARDLTLLSLALIRNHPVFYRYFNTRDFVYQRYTMYNHNHLLGRMVGMDGIKTGYTVDAGFALAASAVRGNRRLIAVILGEPSIAARNRDVTALLEAGFSVMDRRGLGQQVTVASVLPTLGHPALRTEPFVEQGSLDDGIAPIARRLRPALRRAPERTGTMVVRQKSVRAGGKTAAKSARKAKATKARITKKPAAKKAERARSAKATKTRSTKTVSKRHKR